MKKAYIKIDGDPIVKKHWYSFQKYAPIYKECTVLGEQEVWFSHHDKAIYYLVECEGSRMEVGKSRIYFPQNEQ